MASSSKQEQIQQSQAEQQFHLPSTRAKLFVRFIVALKRVGVLLPIVASAMTLVFYFFYSGLLQPWTSPDDGSFLILIAGLLSTLVFALIYALCSMPFVALTSSGMEDYVFLEIIEKELRARLGYSIEQRLIALSEHEMIKQMSILSLRQDSNTLTAYREAYNAHLALYESLYFPKGVQMLSSMRDIYAWGMTYHTQEALTEIEPIPRVVREAKHDYAAIQASNIVDRDQLLKALARAIAVLDPQAGEDLNENESEQGIKNLSSLSPSGEGQIRNLENTQGDQPALEAETRARASIRSIKCRLHMFQQDRLAEVLQARNNLALSILASGLITYTLLFLSIATITGSPPPPQFTPAFTAAVVIYTTGVAAGLFGRLYAEANKDSAARDYGLSRKRLQAIPLISGLAAIGGVFIATTAFSAPNVSAFLTSVFTLNVRNVLMAMIFGFTPNLLIRSFQRHSDQYASELEKTRVK